MAANLLNFDSDSPAQQSILGSDPDLQQKRLMAQLLMGQGMQERPIKQHWAEAISPAMNKVMGALLARQSGDELKTQTSKYQTDMASMLAGGQPGNWTNPDTGVAKEYGGGYQGMIDAGIKTGNPALQDKVQAIQLKQAESQAALKQAEAVARARALSKGGTYSTTPQVTGDGRVYVTDKNGNIKYLDGITPREKLDFQNTGGSTVGVNPYDGQKKVEIQNTVSPSTKYAQDEIWKRHNTPSPNSVPETFSSMTPEDLKTEGLPEGTIARRSNRGKVDVIQKAPGADMSAEEKKAAGFAQIAHDASTVIDEIEGGTYLGSDEHKSDLRSEWVGTPHVNMGVVQLPAIKPMHMLGMTSDTGKRYEQAKKQWLSSVMYKFSGAQITEPELARLDEVYFPQRNDDPQTIKQKTAARQSVLAALQTGSGKEYENIQKHWTANQGSSDVIAHHEKFGDITQADLELTAKEEGITVEEVKRRLGIK